MARRVLVIITFSLALLCCRKKDQSQQQSNNPVPSIPVELTIYPNDPLNFSLQGIGGWKYFNGGINGIIIYRKSQQEFVAIERTSSYLPNDAGAKVKVLNDNFTLKDTVSGSKWQIFDGTVIGGPAQWPLRLYATNFDGSTLFIRN